MELFKEETPQQGSPEMQKDPSVAVWFLQQFVSPAGHLQSHWGAVSEGGISHSAATPNGILQGSAETKRGV